MNNISVTARPTISKRQRLGRDLWRDKWLYVMLIPGIVFFLLFKLKPFTWFAISIYEYNPFGDGPFSGDFVGVKYFKMLFSSSNFWKLLELSLIHISAVNEWITNGGQSKLDDWTAQYRAMP